MKPSLLSILILLIQISCDPNHDHNSIRPKNTDGARPFYLKDFARWWPPATQVNLHLREAVGIANPADIAVYLEHGTLKLIESNLEPNFDYPLSDGKLEVINRGEFGGELHFIPSDTTLEKRSIIKTNVNFIFEFEKKLYFTIGVYDEGAAIFELIRTNGSFQYVKILDLDSAPRAMAIYNNKIYMVCYSMFTIIDHFQKQNILEDAVWCGLSPNSMAIKNEDEIYVGMHGGYFKLSVPAKTVEFYLYTGK